MTKQRADIVLAAAAEQGALLRLPISLLLHAGRKRTMPQDRAKSPQSVGSQNR